MTCSASSRTCAKTVPERSQGAAALAVVAVDNAQVAALALVSLAVSCAQQGSQVVVADLCSGAPAARLLGARDPGVRAVSMNGAQLVVAVPDHDDVLPTGPLPRASPSAQPAAASEALAAPTPRPTSCSPWSPSTPRSAPTTSRPGPPMSSSWSPPDGRRRPGSTPWRNDSARRDVASPPPCSSGQTRPMKPSARRRRRTHPTQIGEKSGR